MSDEQNQLDELRRVIRELPDDWLFRMQHYEPNELGLAGWVSTEISRSDLKALEAELARVETESKKLIKEDAIKAIANKTLFDENTRLTERVRELESLLYRSAEVFQELPSRRYTEELTDGIKAALKSKEAAKENE